MEGRLSLIFKIYCYAVRLRNRFGPVSAEHYLGRNYFMNLELHQGGCGAFEWSPVWKQIARFSMGIPFKITPTIEGGKPYHL